MDFLTAPAVTVALRSPDLDLGFAAHVKSDGVRDEAESMCTLVQLSHNSDVATAFDGCRRTQHNFSGPSSASSFLRHRPSRVIGIVCDDNLHIRAQVQEPQHVTRRQ